jgi:hypothetical protein
MQASSEMREISMSLAGRASRIASSGTSVWPPAMMRASSSRASKAQVSLRFCGLA